MPKPVSRAYFKTAHDPKFVDAILDGRADNGFRNTLESVTNSLPYTTGAMLGAAREAVRHRQAAIAPVSGVHHACYNYSDGFCTFNGLVVTAQVLARDGIAQRVGIVDCDQHYGDGTDDCIQRLGLTHIRHFTAGREFRRPDQVQAFFDHLPDVMMEMQDCDVILYQAGADPDIDDR